MLHALTSFLGFPSDRRDNALSKNAMILVFVPSDMLSRFSLSEINSPIACVGRVGTGAGGGGGEGGGGCGFTLTVDDTSPPRLPAISYHIAFRFFLWLLMGRQ